MNSHNTTAGARGASHSRFSRHRSGGFKRGPAPTRFGGGGNFRRGSRPKQNRGAYIDPSKFVYKASDHAVEVAYTPKHSFNDFLVHEQLKRAIETKGYKIPTPIQDQAIPFALEGKDLVGIADTGTGKTAAFLIPLLNKVMHNRDEQTVIIVPTRELAIQIESELKGFNMGQRIFSVVCVGGAPIGPQIRDLRYHNQFIIGTPGRLKDLIDRGLIKLSKIKTIVLDEADRMLDMGFIGDMRMVMNGMPKDRQTLFFSATLSPEIDRIIGEFLTQPVRVSVKKRDTSKNVDQDVVRIAGRDRITVLHELLSHPEFEKVIVFGRTKHGVEKLTNKLQQLGHKAESIHGDKNHSQRVRALNAFKEHKAKILVATDVAARGLDIPNVSHVINYEIPQQFDDYVHRIGRTGRGNKKGKALTFID